MRRRLPGNHQVFPLQELVAKSDSSFNEVIPVAEWLNLGSDWHLGLGDQLEG